MHNPIVPINYQFIFIFLYQRVRPKKVARKAQEEQAGSY
jgi:hypothetical protein